VCFDYQKLFNRLLFLEIKLIFQLDVFILQPMH
jgi:hypothetical protein